MEPIVSPPSCALAVALPLTEAEFLRDVEDPSKDFARNVVATSGRPAAAAWREVYAPKVARLCDRIAAHARSLGATVAGGATAPVLRQLLEEFPLVSLFAHSISSPVRPADLRDPRAILARIAAGETIVARQVRGALADRRWSADDATLRDQLADALDGALAPTRDWTETTVRADLSGRPARLLSRIMLEDCFGAAMRRAPILELCDGVKTMDDLLAVVPPGFAGVLDLSVCNSFALGESIKRQRRNCLIIENVFLARADLRLARYGLVLNRLARQPARYTDALTEVSLALLGGTL
jgi:hypothetical protein